MSLIKLQGNASGTGAFTIAAPNGNTDRTLTLPDATGTVLAAPAGSVTINSSAPSNSLTLDASGNLGIGTSSPTSRIDAQTPSGTNIAINATKSGTDAVQMGVDTGPYINGGANLGLRVGGSERARIASDGGFFLGTTTTPTGSTGGSGFSNSTLDRKILRLASTSTATGVELIQFWNPNGQVGLIQTNASSTTFATSSDYRLKEDWQPMTGASERVLALKPVNFAWKADGSRVDGFLAHEAQEVVPEAVAGAKDEVDDEGNPKYQGIDQSKLVPLLTAALQEALAEIANLKTRLTALEAN